MRQFDQFSTKKRHCLVAPAFPTYTANAMNTGNPTVLRASLNY